MLDTPPSAEEMIDLIGPFLYNMWQEICAAIDARYDMEHHWNSGGKAWTYEYKYRKGSKTLCALYAKKDCIGCMVIFGKAERARFEGERARFSDHVQQTYDETRTYRDGKWLMLCPEDDSAVNDFMQLLAIKRKPKNKPASRPA